MPERWRRELANLEREDPPKNALERARSSLPRDDVEPRPASRLVAGLVAFAVFLVVGGFAFQTLRPRNADRSQVAGATPAHLTIWPELTLADAQAVQSRVDAGDSSIHWRLDPTEVATRFATDVLAWDSGTFAVQATETTDQPAFGSAFSISPTPEPCPSPAPETTIVSCPSRDGMQVSLIQPVEAGSTGIWSVYSSTSADVSLSVDPEAVVNVGEPVTARGAARPGANILLGVHLSCESFPYSLDTAFDGMTGAVTALPCPNTIGYFFVAESFHDLRPQGARPYEPLGGPPNTTPVVGVSIVPVTFTDPSESPSSTPSQSPGPSAGYFIQLPDRPEPVPGSSEGAVRMVATTNLPEGTLISTSSEGFGPSPGSTGAGGKGSSGIVVRDGTISTTVGNGGCYGWVGNIANSAGFTFTVTATTRFGIMPRPGSAPPLHQPASVITILGRDFENLTGDQVVVNDDGSKSLVATATYDWPEPQCGPDAFPLWGGPECHPDNQQVQGDSLGEVMGEVMGALSQARMCEFWGVELPPDVQAQHPWAEFSAAWRDWYTNPPKDFSDANPGSSWGQPPFTWRETSHQGVHHFVDVTDHGQVILSLELDELPDYCPNCGTNVVPFWGVASWTFH